MVDCDKMISQQTYCLVLYTVSCQVIFPHSPGLFSEFYGISNLISALKHTYHGLVMATTLSMRTTRKL